MRRSQRGAALVYGLFTFMGSVAALFFLFNTGQLIREKNQLVNAADATAYSAGVLQAKSLNYLAYTNRSFIANEVLVAQTVSLKSWADYLESWQNNLMAVHPECFASDPFSMVVAGASASFKFDLHYALPCWLLAQDQVQGIGVAPKVARLLAAASQSALALTRSQQLILQASQQALMTGGMNPALLAPARGPMLRTIAEQNYPENPTGLRVVWGDQAGLPDDWSRFTQHYQDEKRQRAKDLVLTAADDGFVRQRSWTSRAVLPVLCGWGFQHQEVRRRGGTELLGFDEWHAADTQSFQRYWTRWRWSGPQCRTGETPTGWAAHEAQYADMGDSLGSFGDARASTPEALAQAHGQFGWFASSAGNKTTSAHYAGIQNFYDLHPDRLKNDNLGTPVEPVLRFGLRLERDRQQLRVTDGSAATRQGQGQLATFATEAPSSGRGAAMHAVSVAEVYYRNPNLGMQAELGSLFQPYWHVRLGNTSLAESWLPLGIGSIF